MSIPFLTQLRSVHLVAVVRLYVYIHISSMFVFEGKMSLDIKNNMQTLLIEIKVASSVVTPLFKSKEIVDARTPPQQSIRDEADDCSTAVKRFMYRYRLPRLIWRRAFHANIT